MTPAPRVTLSLSKRRDNKTQEALENFTSDLKQSGIAAERATLLQTLYAKALERQTSHDWVQLYVAVYAAVRITRTPSEPIVRLLEDDLGRTLFSRDALAQLREIPA